MGSATAIDLGTYRTVDGQLVHCWYDDAGRLRAEREGPGGSRVRVDPSVLTGAVKLSDDPLWPDREPPVRSVLWEE